jgi:anti-sigma factor RsiW
MSLPSDNTPPEKDKSEEKKEDELLSAYLDDATNEDETQRVEARLNQDPEARKTLEVWKKQSHILKDLHPDSEPPPDLVASEVLKAIDRQLGTPKRGLGGLAWTLILLAAAAVAYVAAARFGLVPLPWK